MKIIEPNNGIEQFFSELTNKYGSSNIIVPYFEIRTENKPNLKVSGLMRYDGSKPIWATFEDLKQYEGVMWYNSQDPIYTKIKFGVATEQTEILTLLPEDVREDIPFLYGMIIKEKRLDDIKLSTSCIGDGDWDVRGYNFECNLDILVPAKKIWDEELFNLVSFDETQYSSHSK